MIITCPECATHYEAPAEIFLKGPRKVRCVSCGNSWMQEPPSGEEPENAAMDSDPFMDDAGPDAAMPEVGIAGAGANDGGDDMAAAMADSGDEVTGNEGLGNALTGVDGSASVESGSAAAPDPAQDEPLHDIESAVPERRKTPRRPGQGRPEPEQERRKGLVAALALAAGVAMLAGSLLYFRENIVRLMPSAAPLYARLGLPVNLIGMDFSGIRIDREYENGFPVLTVRGEVVNVSGRPLLAPDVRLGLRGPGQSEIYHWTISIGRDNLQPDERAKFVTRLASPPPEADEIVLRFEKEQNKKLGAL
jgi:predicted Zn finger-like uncharacterized protein